MALGHPTTLVWLLWVTTLLHSVHAHTCSMPAPEPPHLAKTGLFGGDRLVGKVPRPEAKGAGDASCELRPVGQELRRAGLLPIFFGLSKQVST